MLLDDFGPADPHERAEAWRYSLQALRALSARDYVAADPAATLPPSLLAHCNWDETRGRRLVFVNGAYSERYSDTSALRKARPDLHIELGAESLSLVVPPGRLEQLHLVYAHVPGVIPARWQNTSRLHLTGGSVEIIEQHLGAPGAELLGAAYTELEVAPGAALRWLTLGSLPAHASLYRRVRAVLGERAGLWTTHALGGGRLQRFDLDYQLAGRQASCTSRGVFVAQDRQHIDIHLDVRQVARQTTSEVFWRGVADGRGRGILHGAIAVAAGAEGADARLESKNLLLSPHAEIDVRPVLTIQIDEVRASHGATVGQLDERALFYLRSRGVPATMAREMLIAGFCRAAFSGHEGTMLGERLDAWLDRHLAADRESMR